MGYSYALSHTRIIKHTTISFQRGFHILFQQNNSRNWNVDVHCELNSLLEIPVCAQDLLTLQLYYFFGGVDLALFSQSCSFRPDNGLNIFCCELTSTVQTLGALITMESFNDDVYSMRARTQCVPLKIPCMHLFPFLSNSNTFI